MGDRLSELEDRLAEVAESQRQLERRMSALELRAAPPASRPRVAGVARPSAPARQPAVPRTQDLATVTRHVALLGRTLLVLAGGFLLRAITDAGAVPTWVGVSAGLAYAVAWVALADRAGRRDAWSAGFHGASAVLVGMPLLVEAATRFRLLSPAATALALAGFTAAALGVAARRRLLAVAWIVEIAATTAAVALAIAAGRLAPSLLFLVALGIAALWAGYVLDWFQLRWPVALVTDVLMVILAFRAVAPAAVEGPRTALAVQVVFIALYLGSIVTRTLLLGRAVVAFEAAQTAALVLVGLGGAALVTVRSGTGEVTLGAVSVAFGIATYAVAFAFLEHRKGGRANFHLYSSVALIFVLAGAALLLPSATLATGWGALAIASASLARMTRRSTLAAHAAAYSTLAALQGGLLAYAATALLGSTAAPWPRFPAWGLFVLAALGAAAALTAPDHAASGGSRRIPRVVLLCALAIGIAGAVAGWLVPLAAGEPGHGADAGVAATARTAVLAAGAIALAWSARSASWREASWLAFPVLGVGGLKLVADDLARSRPSSLVVSFALYGAALILVPRLRRRAAAAADAAPSVAATSR